MRQRRARTVVRLVGLLLLVGSAVIARVVVADASDSAATATRIVRPDTPIWSPRRIPQVITASAASQRFPSVIAGFAAPGRCVAVAAPGGIHAEIAPTTPLAPASTVKLLTGAAALRVLGAGHVFTTRVATTAPITGGIVHGNVVVVGGADPVLVTPAGRAARPGRPTTPLADLAAALATAHVQRIDGAIVADDSRGDTVRYLPSLEASERFDIGPLGALTVDEGFASGGGQFADPALATAQALQTLLTERGIAVSGGTLRGTAPSTARTIAAVHSPRLDAIVADMLTVSDNYTAEMLVREIAVASRETGSTPAGLRGVVHALAQLGVPTAGIALVDGSGLSPNDRVTCPALLAAVDLGDRAAEHALRTGLAVAGRTGTLAARFVGDPLEGRLRAKTGHIDGVVGLAGIVPTAAGVVRFAFVANGDFSVTAGEDLQVRIARLVASYPAVPAADRLVPAPPVSARETAPPD